MVGHGFAIRIGGSLTLAVLTAVTGLSDHADGLVRTEVTVAGDGCAAQPAAPPNGPSAGRVAEPAADPGAIVWSVDDFAGAEVQALTASDDVVYVATGTSVTALGVLDGERRWRQD